MKTLTARDSKYGFGGRIDLARTERMALARHRRSIFVVMAVTDFERPKALDKLTPEPTAERKGRE